jgi:hypothetical protein
MRRDARRRFARIVSHGCFHWLHLHFEVGVVKLGVGFLTSCLKTPRSSPVLNIAYFGGVAKIGVRTLGDVFLASFPITTGGSPTVNVASFGGVAMIDVVFPTSCPVASLGSSVPIWCLGGFATLGVDFPTSCPMTSPG